MRRPAMYVTGWLLAAIAAVLLAWQGVGAVTDQVTDERQAPLSEEQVLAELESDGGHPGGAGDGTTSTTAATSTTERRPSTTEERSTTTAPPATEPPATTPTTDASPTTDAPQSAPPATSPPATVPVSTTAPPPTTTTTTTTTTPPQAPAETRSYSLVGGSAALRFTPEGVTVLWATPNSGYTWHVEPEDNGVKVEFENESHESRVEGWWDGGPRDRVEEDSD